MPRIRAVRPAAAGGRATELLDGSQKKLGAATNLMRTAANEPAVLDAYPKLGEASGQRSFETKTRKAIAPTVAGRLARTESGFPLRKVARAAA